MGDFLKFETLITPIVIQVVFWIASIVCIIVGLGQMVQGGFAMITGIVTLIFGPLAVRIYCEILILFFRMNDTLHEIKNNTFRSPQQPPVNQ